MVAMEERAVLSQTPLCHHGLVCGVPGADFVKIMLIAFVVSSFSVCGLLCPAAQKNCRGLGLGPYSFVRLRFILYFCRPT